MKRVAVTIDADLEDRVKFLAVLLGLFDTDDVMDQAITLLDRLACAASDGERLVLMRRDGRLEAFEL